MNLYEVSYNEVGVNWAQEVAIDRNTLPTHIMAENLTNAVETAAKYQTQNFQLNKCFVLIENVKIVTESL